MRTFRQKTLVLIIGFLLTARMAYAQSISSSEVINKAKYYDGKVVSYQGEVVGDVMARDQYAWINLYDGQNAIGIWVARDLSKEIIYKGDYKVKGDEIEVIGIFHRSCPEHGGDLDIHAQGFRKIRSGKQIFERIDLAKIKNGCILLGILILLLILDLLMRKRYRKN